jgi:hypothetical protein
VKYSTLAPRGGLAITDPSRLEYLAKTMHTLDDYGLDNVGICLGTMPNETGAYILTRSVGQYWAWSFEDPAQAAAAFRHFEAAPFSDWAYVVADSSLLPLIARQGLLPQLSHGNLAAAAIGSTSAIRFYRSPVGITTPKTPFLLRFPFPNDARPDPNAPVISNEAGEIAHNIWFTLSAPQPVEIDFQDGDEWLSIQELAPSLDVIAEITDLAAEREESLSL